MSHAQAGSVFRFRRYRQAGEPLHLQELLEPVRRSHITLDICRRFFSVASHLSYRPYRPMLVHSFSQRDILLN